jgi:hypothetical protein
MKFSIWQMRALGPHGPWRTLLRVFLRYSACRFGHAQLRPGLWEDIGAVWERCAGLERATMRATSLFQLRDSFYKDAGQFRSAHLGQRARFAQGFKSKLGPPVIGDVLSLVANWCRK